MYRNKSEHLSFSSNGFPQPAQRFAGTKRPQAKTLSPRPEFPQVIPEGKGKKEHLKGLPPACAASLEARSSGEIGLRQLRHLEAAIALHPLPPQA